MKIHFYSPVAFEPWDFRSPDAKGIGGSETSHVEMAWRLARRGHEVVSFAPVPKDGPREDRGVRWAPLKDADFTQSGLWVLYRCPEVLDAFGERHPSQPRWLMCQDVDYPTFTPERIAKVDKVLALSAAHADHLITAYPYMAEKVWITSNGVRCDLIREMEAGDAPPRNPHRIVYASSPDRGLLPLLSIFKRAREFVPDLELHVAYGFANLDKLARKYKHLQASKAEILRLAKQPGVTFHNRLSQPALYELWLSAGLWVHPTDFTETGCITSMEAMALGAVPITRPLWAIKENVGFGILIDGSPRNDALVRARYVGEIVRACRTDLQAKLRTEMMRWARWRFNWERWADQWEMTLYGFTQVPFSQFAFQHKHAQGRILNVGCDADVTNFTARGAVNMDVLLESPITHARNPAHILHDAREPFPDSIGRFDSIILGDILEHLTPADGVRALANAAAVLNNGGKVIVTVPDDGNRTILEQHLCAHGATEYAPGVNAFHHRQITQDDVYGQLRDAGLEPIQYQALDYTFAGGHGVVAVRAA